MLKTYRQLLLFCCLLCLCFSISVYAAPEKNLWPRWQANSPTSHATIDHALWQQFSNHYIITSDQGVSLVKYRSVTPEDKKLLEKYLAELAAIHIDNYNRNEQLAYWINLYNALTINRVLIRYPINSILNINGAWDAQLIRVEGIPLSLNDIEHRIIRPIWNDPRTHYALNCASYSCPNLQKIAYTGANVNQLLDAAAKEYINSRGVTIENGKLSVSKIYVWYQADFGGSEPSVIAHLMQYANPVLKKQLTYFHKIDDSYYDWQLNEAS